MQLGQIQQTALLTLYARALDSRLSRPILGDPLSADIASQIDYDFAKLKVKPNLVYSTALRARRIDDAVRAFTTAHSEAIVLDLGCGLDTRAARCAPPSGVDWYDVDYPEILDLREKYLPGRSHLVAADLTSDAWLEQVPTGRPAMLVAEGLLPFMPGDTFATMIRRLARHVSGGELALNGYTRFAAWTMKYHPTIKALGIQAAQGFDDPREPESWGSGLTLAGEQLLCRDPLVAEFPQPLRAATRFMALGTGMSRQGSRVLRYRF
ncbi:class I SAM-dependent methyltransferase [Nonomuraea sp. NPDC050536]|uniref:class I SAM-dependent methyltransferase n=1 Tax=Nonomuraea sp. NPDC050536 TaxID=3364366 RepID=UPI0037CA9F51